MPDWKMAPLDFAVPYDAPKTVNMMAAAQPIAPKNDYRHGQLRFLTTGSAPSFRTAYAGLKGYLLALRAGECCRRMAIRVIYQRSELYTSIVMADVKSSISELAAEVDSHIIK